MAVPPSSQPSSTPPSKGQSEPSENKKSRKDFKLPDKGKRKGEDDHKKKKDLFDLAGEKQEVKEIKQEIQEKKMEEMKAASSIQASSIKTSLQAISQLIQRIVTDMRIGQVDGKDFTSMNLTSSSDIPEAFAGSNLTLSYQANSLTIHFDNFMTPQQENNAITLIEKNKEQLLEMVQTLQSKNISIQEMSVGRHVIALPRVEPLPPPFQPTQADTTGTRQDREQQQGEGGEDDSPE